MAERSTTLKRKRGYFEGAFQAMGSPCEMLCATDDESVAEQALEVIAREAWRIEDKFSRYLPGNIIDRINHSDGEPIDVDEESANLFDFADSLHRLSNGRFDITSGVLRQAWVFDGSDNVPDDAQVRSILAAIGWHKVRWKRPTITLEPGMQIDLGGVGKEYAVDRATTLGTECADVPLLINFGGDIVATAPPEETQGWKVGIEALDPLVPTAERVIRLSHGALATSGDARRYLLKNGIRYGHILDPTTGWPVVGAPRSITVAADTCTQAGMLATLAMLKGKQAEAFLRDQGIQFWSQR